MSEKKYFDADTAYDSGTLHNWYIDSVSENDSPVWTEEHIDELINDFYIIPRDTKPAEVAPVVQGRWTNYYFHPCGNRGKCSVCGKDNKPTNYCPDCGAKMDESEV